MAVKNMLVLWQTQRAHCFFCGRPKGHIVSFVADPKGTLLLLWQTQRAHCFFCGRPKGHIASFVADPKGTFFFCGRPKGHIVFFVADPKGTLDPPMGTVPFGKGLVRTLMLTAHTRKCSLLHPVNSLNHHLYRHCYW